MDQWVNAVNRMDPGALPGLFALNYRSSDVPAILQNILWDNAVDIDKLQVQSSWPAMQNFARAYLWWCFYINPGSPLDSLDALKRVFNSLVPALSQPKGESLLGLVQSITSEILEFVPPQQTLWMAQPLLRMFNAIQADRSESKSPILLFVAARLCRVYFFNNQPSLCGVVFNNLKSRDISKYPLSQQVEYRYWLGRFHLNREDLDQGFKELNWAYNSCLEGKNKYTIFEYLAVPSVLVGYMPSPTAMAIASQVSPQCFQALDLLTRCIKDADWSLMSAILANEWIQARRVCHLLESTVPLLVLRVALKTLYEVENSPKKLLFSQVRAALKSCGYLVNEDEDYLLTESVCVSLINAKSLFANIFPASGTLTLRPRDPIPELELPV